MLTFSSACVWALLGLALRELRNWPRTGRPADGALPGQVIVPVHGEDPTLVDATVAHLRRLASDIPITVLSTDAQPPIRTDAAHTYHFRCPADGSSKGALINAFARRGLLTDGTVCIYDADSRPTTVGHSRLDSPFVAQQLSLYTSTRRPGRAAWALGFWSGCATNQTAWSLGYERRALRGQEFYLIGHGLTLDASHLAATGFVEDVPGEDLLFGYRSALRGITASVSPGFDIAGAPDNIRDFFHQSGRWFMGELCALRAVASSDFGRGARVRLVGRRSVGLAFWLGGPPSVLVLGMVSVRSRARWALLTLCLVRCGRWLATEAVERPHCNVSGYVLARLVGFNCKPALAAGGAFWGVFRHGLTGQVSTMPKART